MGKSQITILIKLKILKVHLGENKVHQTIIITQKQLK